MSINRCYRGCGFFFMNPNGHVLDELTA